jgi:hypothetical protein
MVSTKLLCTENLNSARKGDTNSKEPLLSVLCFIPPGNPPFTKDSQRVEVAGKSIESTLQMVYLMHELDEAAGKIKKNDLSAAKGMSLMIMTIDIWFWCRTISGSGVGKTPICTLLKCLIIFQYQHQK